MRASEAIARESARKRATAQSSGRSGVSCTAAVAFVLLLLIPAFIYSRTSKHRSCHAKAHTHTADCRVVSYDVLTVYNPAYASFAAGGNCGMDSNRFAQELDAQKVQTELLQT